MEIATDDRVWTYFARALHLDCNLASPAGPGVALTDAEVGTATAATADAIDAYFPGDPEPEPLPASWWLGF